MVDGDFRGRPEITMTEDFDSSGNHHAGQSRFGADLIYFLRFRPEGARRRKADSPALQVGLVYTHPKGGIT